jgi:1-acyl-sn-glycerol-3-phosphate acyltransferase
MLGRLFQKAFWLWRLFATGLAFTLFGVGGLLAPFFVVPILYMLPGDQSVRQRNARRAVRGLFTSFIYFVRCVGILRWQIDDIEKLQQPGQLILANHPSLLDVVFLGAFVPDATCVVKSGLRSNPAMRGIIKMTGYITNDNGEHLINASQQALETGSSILIFPEGTRSTKGQDLRLQRGAANIALRCQKNITPVIISCTPPTLSKEHKWYNVPDRPFLMTFSVREDISLLLFNDDRNTLASRKLTHYLESYFTRESDLSAKRHS